MVYFDHNATTPLSPAARAAWLEAAERYPGNPSSPHRVGARADAALNAAREELAIMLGCDALDLVWTSGATESAHTVFQHVASSAPADAEVFVSALEHPCVHAAAKKWLPGRVRAIPATRDGVVDLNWLKRELPQCPPALVALMAANNETGVLQPWREVSDLCRAHNVPFFCDAVQWLGKLPAGDLGTCDFVSGCAHKFGGPRGIGFLKCPSKGGLHALFTGGPQEEGRRAGTENVAGALALAAALRERQTLLRSGWVDERAALRREFESQLLRELSGSAVIGAEVPRLWNTVSILMPDADCRARWVVKLDKAGYAVSTGSACASGKEAPSHVLTAMSYSPVEAGRVIRVSSGPDTTREEWHALLAAIRAVADSVRS